MKATVLILLIASLLLLGCTSAPTTNNTNPGDDTGGTPTAATKEFTVKAMSFDFVPSTITVNKGDTVILHVTSEDTQHGISIPQFGVNENLPPGQTVTVQFVADKSGTFPFFCSVFCGSGHQSMKGSLIVK